MKRNIYTSILIFFISFLLAPFMLYFILNSSLYNEYNLYFNKSYYIHLYYYLLILSLICLSVFFVLKYGLIKLLVMDDVIKAELLSIEKIDINSQKSNIMIDKNDDNVIYNVKFKHNNEIILLTVTKESIEKDLSKDEHPYVEYQYINLINIFNRFHNIKVHTKK